MDRQQRILGDLLTPAGARARLGAEIGPLHRALVPKDALRGGAVFYVDHCDTEALQAKWRGDPFVTIDALHVDAVWGEASLRQAIDRSALAQQLALSGEPLDFVVASHVIEHVPDLIGWLHEIHEVLRSDGALRLAVPDKRYCFDLLRQPSSLADVCEAHVCRRRRPSARQILDYALNVVQVDTTEAWAGTLDRSRLQHGHTLRGALDLAHDAETHDRYHDVHCWTFTPESLVQLCAVLAAEGLLPFRCERLQPTLRNDLEFIVWLRRCDDPAQAAASWQAYLGRQ